jgi:hypothetical protein
MEGKTMYVLMAIDMNGVNADPKMVEKVSVFYQEMESRDWHKIKDVASGWVLQTNIKSIESAMERAEADVREAAKISKLKKLQATIQASNYPPRICHVGGRPSKSAE